MRTKTKLILFIPFCISLILLIIDYWVQYKSIESINKNGVIKKVLHEEFEYLGKKKNYYGYYFYDNDSNKITIRTFVSPRFNDGVRDSIHFMNKTIIYQKDNPENWELYPVFEVYPINHKVLWYFFRKLISYYFLLLIVTQAINQRFLKKY